MEFFICRSSSRGLRESKPHLRAYKSANGKWAVAIHDLEDLMHFQRENKCELVLCENTLEIYDDYRE